MWSRVDWVRSTSRASLPEERCWKESRKTGALLVFFKKIAELSGVVKVCLVFTSKEGWTLGKGHVWSWWSSGRSLGNLHNCKARWFPYFTVGTGNNKL